VPYPTEQAGIKVNIPSWIWEVLDLNLDQNTSYSQSIQENACIETQLGHDRFLPNPFILSFICHPTIRHYTLCDTKTVLNNPLKVFYQQ
jgi:hypothetical protein